MKILQISFGVLSILTLAACSNTWEGIKADSRAPNDRRPVPTTSKAWAGVKADVADMSNWAHGEPSAMEKSIGPAPTAYAKKETGVILKPPSSSRSSGGLVWKQIDQDGNEGIVVSSGASSDSAVQILKPEGLAQTDSSFVWKRKDASSPIRLSAGPKREEPALPAVRPFEYSKDVTVYPVDGDAEPYPVTSDNGAAYFSDNSTVTGDLSRQVFFGYGSSRVGTQDSRGLRSLASSLLDSSAEYNVNVVGHASKRVDNVRDPIRKKMINFAIAQKRADAVTRELNNAGVQPLRVMSISRGDEMPNPSPGSKGQEAADRRVDVYIDAK